MPKHVPPLTELQIRKAKPRDKIYSLTEGGGLSTEIMPTGPKSAPGPSTRGAMP